jgi:hypothetical protein
LNATARRSKRGARELTPNANPSTLNLKLYTLIQDGKKMSKRLKNYPDPELVVNAHGADALRMYLINSPVVRGEELRFREEGVRDVVRDVLIPWYNSYRFLIQVSIQTPQPSALNARPLPLPDPGQDSRGYIISRYKRKDPGSTRLGSVLPPLLKGERVDLNPKPSPSRRALGAWRGMGSGRVSRAATSRATTSWTSGSRCHYFLRTVIW